MKISEMIEVLQAAERGEAIDWWDYNTSQWFPMDKPYGFDFNSLDYRIAPKKEMTLVEELRNAGKWLDVAKRAADRIELLEGKLAKGQYHISDHTTDELLAELKRRTE